MKLCIKLVIILVKDFEFSNTAVLEVINISINCMNSVEISAINDL